VALERTGEDVLSDRSAIDAVNEWVGAGKALRHGLIARREALRAALQETDEALVRLDAAEAGVHRPEPEAKATPEAKDMTVSDAIMQAVKEHPGGATINEIRQWLERSGKKFEMKHLATYMNRLKNGKRLVARGSKPPRRYVLAPVLSAK
jgi:hypothetical protein